MTKEYEINLEKLLILLPARCNKNRVVLGTRINEVLLKTVPRRLRRNTMSKSDAMDNRILYDEISIKVTNITSFLADLNNDDWINQEYVVYLFYIRKKMV